MEFESTLARLKNRQHCSAKVHLVKYFGGNLNTLFSKRTGFFYIFTIDKQINFTCIHTAYFFVSGQNKKSKFDFCIQNSEPQTSAKLPHVLGC